VSSVRSEPELAEFRGLLLGALPQLRRFARSYCGSPADADDAVQITCERALDHWQQWSGDGAFDHWVIKILVNAWRDELRSRKLRSGPDIDAIPEPAQPEEDVDDQLYLQQIYAEIMRLPQPQREVLLLVVSEGLSYQETATILEIPVGTVMSRLARARQTLIARVGSDYD